MHAEEHSLHSSWTWFFHKAGGDGYKSALVSVHTFNTVESFWRLKNNIPLFEKAFCKHVVLRVQKSIVTGASVFRGDITPEWEHASNLNGVIMECKGALEAKVVDDIFLNILLKLVGNTAPLSCNGVRVVHKSGRKSFYKIELWFRQGSTTAERAFGNAKGVAFQRAHA
tara:strand:+ start:282 stop:788 length:507 start_codon:yes stop_codon:yes gene_type:complete